MTRIESEKVEIEKSCESVFIFLSDFNNFQKLMPEQVTDWESDADTCSFNIKGMASLGMAIESRTPNSEIKIKRNGKAPFDFFLTCEISEASLPETSFLKLYFDADLNPFLKMMAEKPLTNFLNLLVSRFRDLSAAGT